MPLPFETERSAIREFGRWFAIATAATPDSIQLVVSQYPRARANFFICGKEASYFLSSLPLCTLIRMFRLAFDFTSRVGTPVHLLTDFFITHVGPVHFAAHFQTLDGSLDI